VVAGFLAARQCSEERASAHRGLPGPGQRPKAFNAGPVNAAPAEVAGEFDTRSDKPVLRISRRACHVARYQPLTIDLYRRYNY
jgi:hypothetical protein